MRSNSLPRVLAIGLDGATFDLLRKWIDDENLPNLSRLVRTGSSGVLESVFPPVTAVAFASLMTGKKPANHGILDFQVKERNSYRRKVATPSQVDGEPFWKTLSSAGIRVGAIHVPFAPVTPLNGFVVAGHPLGTHLVTYPPELAKEVLVEVKNYRLLLSDLLLRSLALRSASRVEDAQIKRYMMALDVEAATTTYLMRRYPWDFLITHFFFGDQIQHRFWRYLDDFSAPESSRSAILDYYRHVDRIIGEILKIAGDGTTVFIFSDHGFGEAKKQVYLNSWLVTNGYLKLKSDGKERRNAFLTRENLSDLAGSSLGRLLARVVPRSVARPFFWSLPPSKNLGIEDIDFTRSTAYSFGNVGQIYLNVKGRDPQGVIEPGVEYDNYRKRISSELKELRDPESDERVVDRVFTREELFEGKYSELAPDLALVMRKMSYLALADDFGSEFVFGNRLFGVPGGTKRRLSGWHRLNGILIASGPCMRKGFQETGGRIIDLAPTILHLLGVSIPETMDGRVLTELFEPGSEPAERPSIKAPAKDQGVEIGAELDSQEELKKKLRALGYLG
jgi:predicted AlkP superfamily phosphohydrolase/phosphomutase